MSAELERLCAGLAGEGTTEAAALGFSLESAKAREKLQEFALDQPENFQLLALAGLYALGCRKFEVVIDADDFEVRANCHVSRLPFDDLWSFVSRGGTDSSVIGCRLLAMAILTSVRLGEIQWRMESRDDRGGWQFGATVRRGLLTERKPGEYAEAAPGVVLAAKRKALSQVARRFVSRWWSGGRHGADETLLRERLFLPDGASLICNGQSLLETPSAAGVLAVLTTGDAPTLVQSPVAHRVERDYSMTLLLCDPTTQNRVGLPGEANHTTWIWNGLRMDSTVLGAELDCFRAFVWAPELRPDLSFRSLADNRDKQALERNVRLQARELLDRWVRSLSEEILATPLPPGGPLEPLLELHETRLAIVRNAIRERIDTRKDWRRYASLNRALFEFPLWIGSGPDGRRSRVSLATIMVEFQAGRPVALFRQPPEDVPAWPGRPLVIYTTKPEADFLSLRFPQFEFGSAKLVSDEVRQRLAAGSTLPRAATTSSVWRSGQLDFRQIAVKWTLARENSVAARAGALHITGRGGATAFQDESLGLPPNFIATAQADWEQSYRGGLRDRELASELRRALLESFARSIPDGSAPDLQGYALSGLLLGCVNDRAEIETVLEHPWLVVRTLDGQTSWLSPQALDRALEKLEAPLYTGLWSFEPPPGLPPYCRELPVALLPKEAERGLGKLLKRRVHSAGAFHLLGQRASPGWREEDLLWSARLEADQASAASPAFRRLAMGLVKEPFSEAEVFESLWGRYLGKTTYAGVPPELRLEIDWARGWPNNGASQRLSTSTGPKDLRAAWMALLPKLFQEASLATLGRIPSERLGGWMFDLLSEPATAAAPVFILGDGRRVGLDDVPEHDGVVRYFESLEGNGEADAVFLPGPMREGIELISSLRWVAQGAPAPGPEPGKAAPSSDRGRAAAGAGDKVHPPPSEAFSPPCEPAPSPAAETTSEPANELDLSVPPEPEGVASAQTGANTPAKEPPRVELPGERPAASWAAPAQSMLLPEPVTAGDPVFPSQLSGSAESALESELAALGLGLEFSDFASFVRSARIDPSATTALAMEGEVIVIGEPCQRALSSSQGRRILLSGLFSAYRRGRSSVVREHVLEFHRALLHASLGPPRPRL